MFERKTWVNRQSEHPARRRLTPTGNDNEYDVARAEGVVMEDGDAFDADTMNDLERRVAAGFAEYDPAGLGAANVTVQLYTCTKTGQVYELTGSGAVGRCKIPAAWADGDSFTVNGTAVPAYCGADAVDGDCIVAGRWVLFTFDGTQLNFNGGGGLSLGKLAQATASEKHVLCGKKFYAKDKTLRVGSLPNLSTPKSAGGDAPTALNSQYPKVGVDVTEIYWYTKNVDGTLRLCLRPNFGAFGGESGVMGADGYVGIATATLGNATPAQVLAGALYTSGASGKVAASGTMRNNGSWPSADKLTLESGNLRMYKADGYTAGGLSAAASLLGGASAADIMQGATASSANGLRMAGSIVDRGNWSAEIAPGGLVTVPAGRHGGGGKVTAKALKTLDVDIYDTVGGDTPWHYTLTGGTLVGVANIAAASGGYSECGSLWISGNTVYYKWSGDGVIQRRITLLYY